MNEVLLIGNLTDMPVVTQIAGGVTKCTFRLATERGYRNKQNRPVTDFHSIVTWNSLAEACGKYLAKGKLCAVKGHIQYRSYTQDNTKHYITEIVAETVKFLSSGYAQNNTPADPAAPYPDGYIPVDPDKEELPF